MKIEYVKVETRDQEKAVLYVTQKTEDILAAAELLSGNSGSIPVKKDNENVMLKLNGIYYLESVDKKTFIYTKDDCYETKNRLYEMEELLPGSFVRCSKAMIVNMKKIKAVKSELSGRMNATLLNGEEIVISRSYVKELKRRLEIG